MALDINPSLDFGMAGGDKKSTGYVFLCLSLCICLLASYQFRFWCSEAYDLFTGTAQAVYDRDQERQSARAGAYRSHASDSDDSEEAPVHIRSARREAARDFADIHEEDSLEVR
jgi:hypothetical protein